MRNESIDLYFPVINVLSGYVAQFDNFQCAHCNNSTRLTGAFEFLLVLTEQGQDVSMWLFNMITVSISINYHPISRCFSLCGFFFP